MHVTTHLPSFLQKNMFPLTEQFQFISTLTLYAQHYCALSKKLVLLQNRQKLLFVYRGCSFTREHYSHLQAFNALNITTMLYTWVLTVCLYLNLKHGNLDHSVSTSGQMSGIMWTDR